MSAYIVDVAHIRALVNSGMSNRYPLRWLWQPVTDPEENAATYQRGEAWGPMAGVVAERARRELNRGTAQAVGQMLLAENHRSVDHRYDEASEVPEYVHKVGEPLAPVAALKALDGYEYQSCEAPEWATSQAKAFCDALRRHLVHQLPGYDAAPWAIDGEPAPPVAEPAPVAKPAKLLDLGRGENAAVKAALRAAGLEVVSVRHGRGTARGWLHVAVRGPKVPLREDPERPWLREWDRQSPEFARHEEIRRLASRAILQATGRDASKDDAQTDYFESNYLVDVVES